MWLNSLCNLFFPPPPPSTTYRATDGVSDCQRGPTEYLSELQQEHPRVPYGDLQKLDANNDGKIDLYEADTFMDVQCKKDPAYNSAVEVRDQLKNDQANAGPIAPPSYGGCHPIPCEPEPVCHEPPRVCHEPRPPVCHPAPGAPAACDPVGAEIRNIFTGQS